MANCYIAEFDLEKGLGELYQIGHLPPAAMHVVPIQGTPQVSRAMSTAVNFIRVVSDKDCLLAVSDGGDEESFKPALWLPIFGRSDPEFFAVKRGQYIAVIAKPES